MKTVFTTIFLCCFIAITSVAQTDSLKISLLTYSPLPDISAAFGHTAVRVQDFRKQTDVIYNYGIFDYDEPNFVLKFLRGKLQYQLGKSNTQQVFNYYNTAGTRQIIEQEFKLQPNEQRQVIDYLENNYLPENRKYYYDFFFDNCATRIRDIIETVLGNQLKYKVDNQTDLTFRQLLDVHVASRPWDDFGMDLLIGIPSDQKATYREQMFLPSYLSQNLGEGVEVVRPDTGMMTTKLHYDGLLGAKKIVVDGENYMNQPSWFRPFVVFGILCLIMLLLTLAYKHNRLLARLDGILFLLLGIVGVFLLLMWFATDHAATQWNMNILWANPLYLLFFLPIIQRKTKGMKIGYGMAFFSSIFILLTWTIFPQQFHTGVLPIILMMLVRSGSAFLYIRQLDARFSDASV